MYYLIPIFIVVIFISYIVYVACKQYYFFRRWGIPVPREYPFLGVIGLNILRKYHVNYGCEDLYNFDKRAKYVGCHFFMEPLLVVRDAELTRSIFTKDFEHFSDRKIFIDESIDPIFAKNLFALNGERWREIRNLLSPSFTSNKMRSMYTLMTGCAESFVRQALERHAGAEATDTKDLFSRYANDVIASCAFGIEIDSMREPDNEFYMRGVRCTNFAEMRWRMFMLFLLPNCLARRCVRIVSKEDTDFFADVIGKELKRRREEGTGRPDMLQLMMEAHQEKRCELDLAEMTAHAFVFFFGGFETTASHMCMLAYELATRPRVQEKLREEIDDVMKRCQNEPTYEDINEMTYLDAVIAETLRMHPMGAVSRVCRKRFQLPPAVPGARPYEIQPGVQCWIPVAGVHKDPAHFDDPEEFRPERFIGGKKPFWTETMFMAFGQGPRMCIGNRFAILETKVLFIHLLAKCELLPCEKTCIPLKYDVLNMTPTPKGGSWLRLEMRK